MYSLFNITAYEYVTTQRVTQQNELAYNGKYFIVHHCFLSKPKIQRKSITALLGRDYYLQIYVLYV